MNIPFVDLKTQYLSLKGEIDKAIFDVIEDLSFVGTSNNKYVSEFENKFSEFTTAKYCIACANGTDSLEISLKALGIGIGDEVIVPSLSWIATSEAVSNIGATPVFVDIEPEYYTIDVNKIEEKITTKTKAIIPVHLYGHPADMEKILKIASKNNLKVVEDCAQAHGAKINGKVVGTFGDLGSFSFFPGKNLGAFGDAGGIVTNNEALAKACRMISQHGQLDKKHYHYIEGRNSRMDGIQASVLNVKLEYLTRWNDLRNEKALLYSNLLNGLPIQLPKGKSGNFHAFHLYVIRCECRDDLMKYLGERGIATAIQYPTSLPFLEAYKQGKHIKEHFPISYEYQSKILSLPIFPELTSEQVVFITDQITGYFSK